MMGTMLLEAATPVEEGFVSLLQGFTDETVKDSSLSVITASQDTISHCDVSPDISPRYSSNCCNSIVQLKIASKKREFSSMRMCVAYSSSMSKSIAISGYLIRDILRFSVVGCAAIYLFTDSRIGR